MLFSPQTIDTIPKLHIFSESIGCILCPYNTKVRSNLVLHLNGHKIGQDITAKEIVNPVPIKSELMFDKMINLSASSFEAMNTEKVLFNNCKSLVNFFFLYILLFIFFSVLIESVIEQPSFIYYRPNAIYIKKFEA